LMLLVIFGLSNSITAQVPQGINYQAVARNSSNQLLRQSNVNIEIAIHSGSQNGPLVWAEYHAGITTDTFGLFTLVIGTGVNDSVGSAATFSAINWASGSYYLRVYMSQVGHPTFSQNMGTDQLWSVPYALYAGNVGPTGATVAKAHKLLTNNQSIPSTTSTLITLDSLDFDTGNNFSSNRFTASIDGYYQVNGSICYDGSSAQTYCGTLIFKNGVKVTESGSSAGGINSTVVTVSDIIHLGIGDYIELYGYQGFGSALSICGATYLSISLIK